MSDYIKLSELNQGDRGLVTSVCEKDKNLSTRLMSLGLLEMTPIEVVSVAPLGDPIMIAFRGTVLSLRRSEASCIKVQLAEEKVFITSKISDQNIPQYAAASSSMESFSIGDLPKSSQVYREASNLNSFVLGTL